MTKALRYLAGGAVMTWAVAAMAGSYSFPCSGAGCSNDRWEGNTYWTIYARGQKFNSITVNDSDRRDVSLDWESNNDGGADYVAGGGWGGMGKPTNVDYKLFDWSTTTGTGGRGTFGLYGWSCFPPAGNLDVEFYVVDRWFGGWAPPTSDAAGKYKITKRGQDVVTNNGTYRIYDSGQISGEPTRCGKLANGQWRPFKQVWAVRTANRTVQPNATTGSAWQRINFSVLQGPMAQLGYFMPTYEYLVVGAEGLGVTKGHIRIQANRN